MKRPLIAAIVVVVLLVAGYLTYPIVFEGRPTSGERPEVLPPVTQVVKESSQQVRPGVSSRNVTVSVFIKLQVDDVKSAHYRLSEVASRYGGYVQSSSIYEGGGYVTLRIPAERLERALDEVRSMGRVEREERSVEDVTEQVLDIETRLKNLRATESRLVELLSKAEKVSDVIEIEDKLSQVRQQIEWLEAMRRNLQLMVNYSTVSVELRKSGYLPPEEDPLSRIWEDARKAFLGSLYLIVVGVAFLALPLALVGVVYLAYRRLKVSRGPG